MVFIFPWSGGSTSPLVFLVRVPIRQLRQSVSGWPGTGAGGRWWVRLRGRWVSGRAAPIADPLEHVGIFTIQFVGGPCHSADVTSL